MKENNTKLIGKVSKWLALVVTLAIFAQVVSAATVFDNTAARQTQSGNSLYFTESYEFGDQVTLLSGVGAFLTNFTFEYYADSLPVTATMQFRVYANNGAAYGTNSYGTPGDMLYDSGAFNMSGYPSGFNTLIFDAASGFAVPVPSNFTWTVEFAGVGAGSLGLAMYDGANSPTVGTDYTQYWEHVAVGTNSWTSREPSVGSGLSAINFGATATSQALGLDTDVPKLVVSGPLDKYRTTNQVVTVTGTASDKGGVGLVLYKLNSASYRPVTTFTTGIAANSNWTAVLNLNVGPNTFSAKVIDRAGKSFTLPKALNYAYVVTNTLTVILADGASSATLAPNWSTTNLEVNQTYTLSVTPAKQLLPVPVQLNWYSNTVASSLTSTQIITAPKFTFVMQTNLVLTVNCPTNRFRDVVGDYYGLIGADSQSQKDGGFIKVTVSSKADRSFSGLVNIAGEKFGIAGVLALDGTADYSPTYKPNAKLLLKSKNQTLTNTISLQLNFDASKTITGTMSNKVNGYVASIQADKYVWASGDIATNYAGRYTVAIPSVNSNPTGPIGYSFMHLTVSTNGSVAMLGYTADAEKGNKIVQAVKISKDGDWPVFSVYNPDMNDKKLFKGSVSGWLSFEQNSSPAAHRTTGNLTWIKMATTNAYYPNGFTNVSTPIANNYVMNKDLSGKLTNAMVTLGYESATNTTGYIYLTGDSVNPAAISPIQVRAFNNSLMATVPAKLAPYGTLIKAVAPLGQVNGSFVNPNGGAVTKFNGIALQSDSRVYGYFMSTNGYQSVSYVIQP